MAKNIGRTFPLISAGFKIPSFCTLLSYLSASSWSARLASFTSLMLAAWTTGSRKRTVETRKSLRCILMRGEAVCCVREDVRVL